MVLIFLVQKSVELITMSDPTIHIQSRQLYKEEVEDFGDMLLDEYRFNLGVFLQR